MLDKKQDSENITSEDYNALVDYINTNVVVGGDNTSSYKRGAQGKQVIQQPETFYPVGGPNKTFFGRITGSNQVGATNRYEYTFTQVYKTSTWASDSTSGAWELGSYSASAYNLCEVMNNSVGTQGNGIDVDGADFPAGFTLKPCPINSIVSIVSTPANAGSAYEAWFSHVNAVDGTCDA